MSKENRNAGTGVRLAQIVRGDEPCTGDITLVRHDPPFPYSPSLSDTARSDEADVEPLVDLSLVLGAEDRKPADLGRVAGMRPPARLRCGDNS